MQTITGALQARTSNCVLLTGVGLMSACIKYLLHCKNKGVCINTLCITDTIESVVCFNTPRGIRVPRGISGA